MPDLEGKSQLQYDNLHSKFMLIPGFD